MIDMCQKLYANNFACLREFYDQLCQIMETNQEVLIEINVLCQELKGYPLWFLEVMSLYCGEAGMWIEICRGDYYDLSNLQAAE